MISDCTALILAGGDSSRMGQDKAELVLDGQSLLQQVIATMQTLFDEVILSVRHVRTGNAIHQVCDAPTHSGPLAGLAAGLERASTPWVFAVACDMPFLSPAVVNFLAQQRADFQAVIPIVQGYPEPMAAFYATSCLPVVQDILRSNGKHSFRALLEKIRVCFVSESQLFAVDPQLRSFFDLDTPEDLARASKLKETR
jgi:molybdopterin-guanine dinucleotide biosynthesis protein A